MANDVHEEAEHAAHAKHDPFDRRVALTMVVIAALLAGVRLLGHRTHNEVLADQIHAGVAHTQASDLHTQESDIWNLYQAQRLRYHLYNVQVVNLGGADGDKEGDASTVPEIKEPSERDRKVLAMWDDKRRKADAKAKENKKDAEEKKDQAERRNKEGELYEEKAEKAHHRANFLDGAELFVELGIVLCSVAILTKDKRFWLGGIVVSVLGFLATLAGMLS